jgi:hypothetical protein
VRDFTVPIGSPVRSAICDWDMPSKYIKVRTSRCSAGSSSRAARTIGAPRGVPPVGRPRRRGRPAPASPGDRILRSATVGLLAANQVDGAVVDHAHEPGLHRASLGVVASGFLQTAMNASCTISSARCDCRTTRCAGPWPWVHTARTGRGTRPRRDHGGGQRSRSRLGDIDHPTDSP